MLVRDYAVRTLRKRTKKKELIDYIDVVPNNRKLFSIAYDDVEFALLELDKIAEHIVNQIDDASNKGLSRILVDVGSYFTLSKNEILVLARDNTSADLCRLISIRMCSETIEHFAIARSNRSYLEDFLSRLLNAIRERIADVDIALDRTQDDFMIQWIPYGYDQLTLDENKDFAKTLISDVPFEDVFI